MSMRNGTPIEVIKETVSNVTKVNKCVKDIPNYTFFYGEFVGCGLYFRGYNALYKLSGGDQYYSWSNEIDYLGIKDYRPVSDVKITYKVEGD